MDYLDTRDDDELKTEFMSFINKKKVKKRLITIAVVCVLLIVSVGSAWFSGRKIAKEKAREEIEQLKLTIQQQQEQIDDLMNNPIVVNPVSPTISLEILYSEINDIAELATIEYMFTNAEEFSHSKDFFGLFNIPFTEKSFILKWDGRIKAGIKVDEIVIELEELDKKIVVTMPAAEILSYETDHDSVEILNEQDNVFNPLTIEDKIEFDRATEESMRSRAIENGVLEKAQANAQTIIKRLISANEAVGDDYTIEFKVIDNG